MATTSMFLFKHDALASHSPFYEFGPHWVRHRVFSGAEKDCKLFEAMIAQLAAGPVE